MTVTFINHSDGRGGASIAAYRLMEALRARGVDARMVVGEKTTDSPYVSQAASRARTRVPFYLEHLNIFTHNGFSRERLFRASIATDGLSLSRHPWVEEADAVVLHWVNQGLLSLDEIVRIARSKPTYWVMHDQWNYTSICHHTGDCERWRDHCRDCHLLGWMASGRDLSARTFDRKLKAYDEASITYVAVSEWLAKRARESKLLGGKPVVTIPNAFPIERLGAGPKLTRAELRIPDGKKVITICSARLDDPDKGLPRAIEMLNSVADSHGREAVAVLVGKLREPGALNGLRLPYVLAGTLPSDVIPSVMAHSDVVVSTSPFETHGATIVEAQAAGATPVCFTHDGRGDSVEDGITGYSITKRGNDALRDALERPISGEALRHAAERYAAEAIARRWVGLFSKAEV